MKLVTFGDERRVGVVDGEEIAVLDVPSTREYFERGGADETGERVALASTRLRAPIVPKKFFHTAGNFREHEEESKQVEWSHEIAPWIVFFQNVDAIVGTDEPVVYPEHLTEELDYELELAVVIGKAGKWFSPEEARDYIAGYVIFNDITARDIQRREMRSGVFSFCKAIDTFCPLGPWILTADEIPDPHDLAMELRVNGEVRQTSHSGRMSVTIPEIVSHYSALGYSAGDVLSTGTVSGVAGFSPDAASLYLKPGDVMEAEIERIGVLRNPVISWQEASRRAGAAASPVVVGSIEILPIVDAVGNLGDLAELYPETPAEAWDPYRAALSGSLRRDELASAVHELPRSEPEPRRSWSTPGSALRALGLAPEYEGACPRGSMRSVSAATRSTSCSSPTSTSITWAGTPIATACRCSSRARDTSFTRRVSRLP